MFETHFQNGCVYILRSELVKRMLGQRKHMPWDES
jgi:hypothetical protein